MIKIHLKDIGPEGIVIDQQIATEVMELTDKDPVQVVAPLKVQAKVERIGDTVLAHTDVQTRYHALCYRCLEDIEHEWSENFILDFLIASHPEFIDLEEDIRQEMILSIPERMLCVPDCKGICPGCGANLNKEKCRCKLK